VYLTENSGAGRARFSDAPPAHMAMCDGAGNYLFGGKYEKVARLLFETGDGFVDATDKLLNDSWPTYETSYSSMWIGTLHAVHQFNFTITTGSGNPTGTLVMNVFDSGLTPVTIADSTQNFSSSGSVVFSHASTRAVVNGVMLYFYQFVPAITTSGITFTDITCEGMGQIGDLWDGTDSPAAYVYSYGVSTQNDAANVSAEDYDPSNPATYLELRTDGTAPVLDLAFTEPVCAITITIADGAPDSGRTIKVGRYTSSGEVYATSLLDGTESSGTSFSQTGTVFWGVFYNETQVTIPSMGPMYKYQVVFDASTTATPKIDKIVGIRTPKVMPSYKFPVAAKERLWLCSSDDEPNKITCSSQNTATVFNGDDSQDFYFGDISPVTAAGEMYASLGSSIYRMLVVTKATETYIISGDSIDSWVRLRVSPTRGCVAPMTFQIANVVSTSITAENQQVAIYQGADAVYMFDGREVIDISTEIKDEFANVYLWARIDESIGFVDERNGEYHWLFCNQSSGPPDREMVYDLRRRKWYRMERPKKITAAAIVRNFRGYTYNYAAMDDGQIYNLDAIPSAVGTQSVKLADVAPEKGSIMPLHKVRHLKLVGQFDFDRYDPNHAFTVEYYGDMELEQTINASVSSEYFHWKQGMNSKAHTFSSLRISSDEPGFQLMFGAMVFDVVREDI